MLTCSFSPFRPFRTTCYASNTLYRTVLERSQKETASSAVWSPCKYRHCYDTISSYGN